MKKHFWVGLVGIIGAIMLVRVPATAKLLWFLLPLGSGTDDLVEGTLLLVLGVYLFVRVWLWIGENIRHA